jgi:ABC-type nickel/cobalt efflux system permease component RcnA
MPLWQRLNTVGMLLLLAVQNGFRAGVWKTTVMAVGAALVVTGIALMAKERHKGGGAAGR